MQFVSAQYVTIPDATFRAYLKTTYPLAFNASDMMDTTNSSILNEWHMMIGGDIFDLEGLHYFKSLETFWFSKSQIKSLPALPNSVKNLALLNNPVLSEIQSFSPDLTQARIEWSPELKLLPSFSGIQLETLTCLSNGVTTITSLPEGLTSLSCDSNQLTSLPPLPYTLEYLSCINNKLTSLPSLNLPNLYTLYCNQNDIYCLPAFNLATNHMVIDDKITCFPNKFNYYDGAFLGIVHQDGTATTLPYNPDEEPANPFPICTPPINTNHCSANPFISGFVFNDNNKNGVKDDSEPYRANVKLQLSTGASAITSSDGYYYFQTEGVGNYTVSVVSPDYYSATPVQNSYQFSSFDTSVSNNYALQPSVTIDKLSIDISSVKPRARPVFAFSYLISYINTGTNTLNPSLTFNYDNSLLNFDSTSNATVTNNGSTLQLAGPSFVPGQYGGFVAYFHIKTDAPNDAVINANAVITANATEAMDSVSTFITSSFDPNDKQATPALTPAQVVAGKYIDYTIRFQNTGNDTAFNIVLTRTLAVKLQQGSVELVASSHKCKTSIKDNTVAVEFLDVLLPDSTTNELRSHGFVHFRIKPVTTAVEGDVVNNKAAIYFDYNSPVITNTANTIITDQTAPLHLLSFTGYQQASTSKDLLYWNTVNETLTRSFTIEQSIDGRIFKAIGTVIAKNRNDNDYSFSTASLRKPAIYYRLKINDLSGKIAYSQIVHLKSQKDAKGFEVLMNPVSSRVYLQITDQALTNTTARLINAKGTVVKSFALKQCMQTIDVTMLPSGTYYIQTSLGSKEVTVNK